MYNKHSACGHFGDLSDIIATYCSCPPTNLERYTYYPLRSSLKSRYDLDIEKQQHICIDFKRILFFATINIYWFGNDESLTLHDFNLGPNEVE